MRRKPRVDTSRTDGRYRPMLARGECPSCGHWHILQNGTCVTCRRDSDGPVWAGGGSVLKERPL